MKTFFANKKIKNKTEQEGHDGPESLTRNNCFSVKIKRLPKNATDKVW
jgi:hypothetical protein